MNKNIGLYRYSDLDQISEMMETNSFLNFRLYHPDSTTAIFIYEPEETNSAATIEKLHNILESNKYVHKIKINIPNCKPSEFLTYKGNQRSVAYSKGIKFWFFNPYTPEEEIIKETEKKDIPKEEKKEPMQTNNNKNNELSMLGFFQMMQQQNQLMIKQQADHNSAMLQAMETRHQNEIQHIREIKDIELDELENDASIGSANETSKIEFYNTLIDKISGIALVVAEKFSTQKHTKTVEPVAGAEISEEEKIIKRLQNIDPSALERLKQTLEFAESDPETYMNMINQAEEQNYE